MNLDLTRVDLGLGPLVCEELVETLGRLELRSRDY